MRESISNSSIERSLSLPSTESAEDFKKAGRKQHNERRRKKSQKNQNAVENVLNSFLDFDSDSDSEEFEPPSSKHVPEANLDPVLSDVGTYETPRIDLETEEERK